MARIAAICAAVTFTGAALTFPFVSSPHTLVSLGSRKGFEFVAVMLMHFALWSGSYEHLTRPHEEAAMEEGVSGSTELPAWHPRAWQHWLRPGTRARLLASCSASSLSAIFYLHMMAGSR